MSEQATNAAGNERVPPEILAAIRAASQIALVGHVTPDADCVGSIAALWLALPELGKTAYAILPADTVARRLKYLLRHAGLAATAEAPPKNFDLALVLDTAKDRRINLPAELGSRPSVPIINIDHHATNTQFGRWNWVVPQASSTSELVHRLLRALGCQITPTIATLLYAGIHSDTQGFSLVNTTAECLGVAQELAFAGARIAEVCERLHRSHSPQEFELLKQVYTNTRVSPDGRLAWSTLSYDEIRATGCNAAVIDDQVEVPRSIEGVLVAILFSEGERGRVRMNFRGEQGTGVLPLAQKFGGGGHYASAGARLEGTLAEVVDRVLPAAREFAAGLTLPNG